jgi:hypothetical protein
VPVIVSAETGSNCSASSDIQRYDRAEDTVLKQIPTHLSLSGRTVSLIAIDVVERFAQPSEETDNIGNVHRPFFEQYLDARNLG